MTTHRAARIVLVAPLAAHLWEKVVDESSSYGFQQHIKKPQLNQTNSFVSQFNTHNTLQCSMLSCARPIGCFAI
jgi:hypothetical protein